MQRWSIVDNYTSMPQMAYLIPTLCKSPGPNMTLPTFGITWSAVVFGIQSLDLFAERWLLYKRAMYMAFVLAHKRDLKMTFSVMKVTSHYL